METHGRPIAMEGMSAALSKGVNLVPFSRHYISPGH